MRGTTLLFFFLVLAILFVTHAETVPDEGVLLESQNDDEVMQLLNAAEAGNSDAMYELGDKYYLGEGVDEDLNAATEWYRKAIKSYIKDAEAGDIDAMFRLGKMYDWGEGVTEDNNIALDWYRKASEAGNNKATYELGEVYYFGDVLEQDYVEAMKWFQEAAETGNSDAMYMIGLMYENGKGVDQDYEQAKGWYKDAIELGDKDAKMRISVIFIKKYYKSFLWAFLAVLMVGGFVFGHEKRALVEDVSTFKIVNESRGWTLGTKIRRYVGGLFVYLIFWLTLWGSVSRVVGASLSPDKATELVEVGAIESIWDYGWGDHYIWFIVMFCVVTFCCAFLTGATTKKKGAFVASIANLPVIISMLLVCWYFYIGDEEMGIESPIAWKIILPLSIAGSIFCSILGGQAGKESQESDFKENSILGIRPFHWSWLWLISSFYIQGIIYALMPIIKFSWGDDNGPGLFQILRLLIYGYPMALMYQILSGEILEQRRRFIKIISFIGIYLGGIMAAILFDLILLGLFNLISYIF